MASIEESLILLIKAAPVGALLPGKPFPLRIGEGATLPAVAYQRISTPREVTHSGSWGLVTARFQLTAWAATYASKVAVVAGLNAALIGYHGTVGGVRIDSILPAGEREDFEPTTQRYQAFLDIFVSYKEN